MGDGDPVLYNILGLLDKDRVSEDVFIVEGEKDADRLISLGFIATCNFDGASASNQTPKWRSELYDPHLTNRNVIILADNDDPGRTHAEHIASCLYDKAESVKVIALPDLPEHGDVSDWLDMDHTLTELAGICRDARTWEPTSLPSGWNIRSLKDAYGERPPCEFLVDGIIQLPSLTIVYAAPGALKTMLLSDMMIAVSSGAEWLSSPDQSGNGFATVQSRVLLIDLENGVRRSDERIGALAKARQLPVNTPLYYTCMPDPRLDGSDPESLRVLANHIRMLGARMLIIDNLGLATGDADENSPEMAQIMGGFRYLAEELNIAIIIIHHQRKSTPARSRKGDSLRGHSSIEASADLAILIERELNSNQITLRATKVREAELPLIRTEFSYVHKSGTKELEAARFWNIEVVDNSSPAAIASAIISAIIGNEDINQSSLIEAVKNSGIEVSKSKIRDQINLMETMGKLSVHRGDHNAKCYRQTK